MIKRLLVTGGAGFIGSCFVLQACGQGQSVLNLDKLTYAGNPENLASLADNPCYAFVRGDIGNAELVRHLLAEFRPDAIVNFAAESHVDRSIVDPEAFVRTNVLGTATLLRMAVEYWNTLPGEQRAAFRFLHVSTDEVFGSLQPGDHPFNEETAYSPNSPYSASKAASDHLVRAFHETYGLPVLVTNCSNNYGPRQFPEKLIPLMLLNALQGKPLPVYGTGCNVRDWLHVEDHCQALALVLEQGRVGETYCIGGRTERSNIEVVQTLCDILEEEQPFAKTVGRTAEKGAGAASYRDLIRFVTDRPGHDLRYAIDCSKMERELGWRPAHTFEQGLQQTVRWYLANGPWVEHVQSGAYLSWIADNYRNR